MFSRIIEIPEATLEKTRENLSPLLGHYGARVFVHEEMISTCFSALHFAQTKWPRDPAYRN